MERLLSLPKQLTNPVVNVNMKVNQRLENRGRTRVWMKDIQRKNRKSANFFSFVTFLLLYNF